MRGRAGFTLVELIVVMGIFLLLLSIGVIGLAPNFTHAEVNSGSDLLLADFKSQQAKAMAGELGGSFGLTFSSDHYTLTPANLRVDLPEGVTLTSTFPGNTVVFVPGSGEIGGSYSLTLDSAGYTDELVFNQYGVRITGP